MGWYWRSSWVDHRLGMLVIGGGEIEHARKGPGKSKAMKGGTVFSEEDHELLFLFTVLLTMNCSFILELDTEYRYWSFMEAHRAHNSFPAKVKLEAMDVLTWAWKGNDWLLFTHSGSCLFAQPFVFSFILSPPLPSYRSYPFH